MNEINPDSYCEIYCGACSVAMHGVTGCVDGFVACLGSVPREELACSGCRHAAEAYKISGWKKLLSSFVLPLAYRKGKAKMVRLA